MGKKNKVFLLDIKSPDLPIYTWDQLARREQKVKRDKVTWMVTKIIARLIQCLIFMYLYMCVIGNHGFSPSPGNELG